MTSVVDSAFEYQEVFEFHAADINAWLVIDRLKDGLSFGGFRFDPSVTLSQVQNLAKTMSYKLASHGLPVGGAKAGIACDPSHPNIHNILAQIAHSWEEQLSHTVILGKDMGATNDLLDSLYRAIDMPQMGIVQKSYPNCPNKIRELTGYRSDMTGLGAVIAAETATSSMKGKSIVIQGAGVVAQGIAIHASARGARVVGISDINTGMYCPSGLNLVELINGTRANKTVFDIGALKSVDVDELGRDQIYSKPADIVFLAAGSDTVDELAAEKIAAPLVVEASNFGLTKAANDILFIRGIDVIPDSISSSSSAAMTCLQIANGNNLEFNPLWNKIEASIRDAVIVCMKFGLKENCSIRSAYEELFVKPILGIPPFMDSHHYRASSSVSDIE